MNNFTRILPYVWPHRRKVFLSFLFAALVALFWSVNLSVTFPIVKVLLQGQNLDQYVEQEIVSASEGIEQRMAALNRLDTQLQEANRTGNDENSDGTEQLLKDQSRQRRKLSESWRQLHLMNWVRSYVVPFLPGDQFDLLAIILGVLLVATLLKGICVFTQDVLVGSVVELTTMGIRKQCFRHILKLDYQSLHQRGSSDIMSRFTHDMNLLGQGMRLMGGKVIREPLKAGFCIIGAFLVCWQLTLLSMLFVPLVGLFFYRIGRKLKLASRRMMESMSRIYKTLEETLEGIKVVIAFNGARRHRQQFHRENKEYYRKSQKIISIDALTSPTTEVLGFLAALIALLPGAYLVLRETTEIWGITLTSKPMDIAKLSLLYVFLAGVIDPVRKLSTTYSKLKRASAAADRVFDLLEIESLVVETKTPLLLPRHSKTIVFESIQFAYAGKSADGAQRPLVLNNVDLTVQAGEVVVVVGENGSGKSTLVNLLPRYFDPDQGEVRIDGVKIHDVRLRDLRSQIAVVTQETLLFDESITENIRYGKPNATLEEIEQAAQRAHVTPFLEQLPDGLDTRIGEKGGYLSGGQRQRIALARAILRDPAILILDEATSAIDAKSEQLIHETLRHFSRGRTTFLITHSVSRSILDFVTRIVVMDEGKLIAAGRHEELIESCPVYQRLFNVQVRQSRADQPTTNSGEANEIRSHIIPLHANRANDDPLAQTVDHSPNRTASVPPPPHDAPRPLAENTEFPPTPSEAAG